jgi:hypothetical protein
MGNVGVFLGHVSGFVTGLSQGVYQGAFAGSTGPDNSNAQGAITLIFTHRD